MAMLLRERPPLWQHGRRFSAMLKLYGTGPLSAFLIGKLPETRGPTRIIMDKPVKPPYPAKVPEDVDIPARVKAYRSHLQRRQSASRACFPGWRTADQPPLLHQLGITQGATRSRVR